MNVITLIQPPRIVFGNGCAALSAAFLAQRGEKRVLLVTSQSVRPQINFLVEALQKADCEVVEARLVPPELTLITRAVGAERISSSSDRVSKAYSMMPPTAAIMAQ